MCVASAKTRTLGDDASEDGSAEGSSPAPQSLTLHNPLFAGWKRLYLVPSRPRFLQEARRARKRRHRVPRRPMHAAKGLYVDQRHTTWLPQFSVVRIDTVRSVVSSKSAHAKIRVDTGVPVSTGVKLHNPLVRHTTVERLGEAPACTAKQRGKESCLTTCLYGDHAQCVTQCVGYDARARAFPSISVVSSRVGAGRRTLY
jgi:hypothetical protein